MEQLNKKRDDLKNQQKVLNSKIATREEKQSYLVNRKNELEARKNELNRKSFRNNFEFEALDWGVLKSEIFFCFDPFLEKI